MAQNTGRKEPGTEQSAVSISFCYSQGQADMFKTHRTSAGAQHPGNLCPGVLFSRDTHHHLWLGGPNCFPLPAASTAAVFCPGVLLHPQAKAGSGVCCRCFPPFSPGCQQEMWEEKQQPTPLELLHPSVSSVVPDGVGACAGHRAMWAHRRGYGRLGRALPPQPVQPVFRAAASRMPIGSLSLFSGHLFPLESLALCLLFWACFFA